MQQDQGRDQPPEARDEEEEVARDHQGPDVGMARAADQHRRAQEFQKRDQERRLREPEDHAVLVGLEIVQGTHGHPADHAAHRGLDQGPVLQEQQETRQQSLPANLVDFPPFAAFVERRVQEPYPSLFTRRLQVQS